LLALGGGGGSKRWVLAGAAGAWVATGAASAAAGSAVAVNAVSGVDLPGSSPVKLAMAARLATVTALAATMIIGCVLRAVSFMASSG
jgi:hypothetical protein